jgi:hypothetical protein
MNYDYFLFENVAVIAFCIAYLVETEQALNTLQKLFNE